MRTQRALGALLVLSGAAGAALFSHGSSAGAQTVPATAPSPAATNACAALASPGSADGFEIVSATYQPADLPVEGARLPNRAMTPGAGPPIAGLPAFCRVVGRIRPVAGSDIGFEVWLPASGWDGRLHGVGIGGFAGMVDYRTLGTALKSGQAGVATDTGHTGTVQESSWAVGHPERVRDYGWRAIHLSTVAAKRIVERFYGRAPDKSYFVGCSGGGRQGLMEAARFPEDYDGILSGAPAANLTDLAMAFANVIQAQMPDGAAIRAEQVGLLQEETIRQCDAGDGQVDGLIDDPRQCRFDVSKLACGTSPSAQCFSQPQIAALQRIFAGPRNSSGNIITPGFLPAGSEVGRPFPSWEGYLITGTGGLGVGRGLGNGFIRDFVQEPFATAETFDFDRDPARLKARLSSEIDAPYNLRRFFARGGKLLVWHGWADAAIAPEATLRYRNTMLRQSGSRARASSQLFMVPGVQHCMGGTGADSFGQVGAPQPGATPETSMIVALQSWVETGRTPGALVGRRGSRGLLGPELPDPVRERLLCAWPKRSRLTPGSDPDKAASYRCVG